MIKLKVNKEFEGTIMTDFEKAFNEVAEFIDIHEESHKEFTIRIMIWKSNSCSNSIVARCKYEEFERTMIDDLQREIDLIDLTVDLERWVLRVEAD